MTLDVPISNQNQSQDMTDEEFLLAAQQLAGQAPIDTTDSNKKE